MCVGCRPAIAVRGRCCLAAGPHAEKVFSAIGHHEENDGVQKGFNELIVAVRVALYQITVPTIDELSFMGVVSYHRCDKDPFKSNLSGGCGWRGAIPLIVIVSSRLDLGGDANEAYCWSGIRSAATYGFDVSAQVPPHLLNLEAEGAPKFSPRMPVSILLLLVTAPRRPSSG